MALLHKMGIVPLAVPLLSLPTRVPRSPRFCQPMAAWYPVVQIYPLSSNPSPDLTMIFSDELLMVLEVDNGLLAVERAFQEANFE